MWGAGGPGARDSGSRGERERISGCGQMAGIQTALDSRPKSTWRRPTSAIPERDIGRASHAVAGPSTDVHDADVNGSDMRRVRGWAWWGEGLRDKMAGARSAAGDTAWIRSALDSVPAPDAPATVRWEGCRWLYRSACAGFEATGVAGLLRGRRIRAGGFDGEGIPWDCVVRIGKRPLAAVATDSALEREARHITRVAAAAARPHGNVNGGRRGRHGAALVVPLSRCRAARGVAEGEQSDEGDLEDPAARPAGPLTVAALRGPQVLVAAVGAVLRRGALAQDRSSSEARVVHCANVSVAVRCVSNRVTTRST